ncbi:MAG: NAD(P)-dependent oxidoreductase [Brevefilum sp.]
MKITIFGSTGGTGQQLVRKALERGHEVTAFARTPSKLEAQHSDLSIVEGDVREPETVSLAIRDADAVINAIGPAPNTPDDLMKKAAGNIISGMQEHGVNRLIWSTGAGVEAPQDEPTLMHKVISFLLKMFSKDILENSLRGAEIVKNSDLDWTIARAPMLTDEDQKGGYQVSYVGPDLRRTLSRANYAEFMLDLAESDEWIGEMPAASDK